VTNDALHSEKNVFLFVKVALNGMAID